MEVKEFGVRGRGSLITQKVLSSRKTPRPQIGSWILFLVLPFICWVNLTNLFSRRALFFSFLFIVENEEVGLDVVKGPLQPKGHHHFIFLLHAFPLAPTFSLSVMVQDIMFSLLAGSRITSLKSWSNSSTDLGWFRCLLGPCLRGLSCPGICLDDLKMPTWGQQPSTELAPWSPYLVHQFHNLSSRHQSVFFMSHYPVVFFFCFVCVFFW